MAAVWGAAAGGELAGAGGAGAGAEGQFPLEQWFYELPPCTRWWTAATVATSVLVQCQVLSPFQLFYSFRSVWLKAQVGCGCRAPGSARRPIRQSPL
ncbi:hypothetical protein KEM52_001773 [Ascosphaera acerosa]|nr:hypothetical protein KEM52_001773 [Ascosphaera acerosa]